MSVFRPGAVELERPEDYRGQATVAIRAADLHGLTPRERARVVDDWCDFFAAGPSGIWDLTFPMRMPKRLFDALASQTQLRRLAVQWGVYDDLSALTNMRHLVELELDSATSVTTLEPLRVLSSLETLEIGGAWRVQDYSPIGDLVGLRQLRLGGGSEKRQAVQSLAFLTQLRELRQLYLDLVPDALDYSPLLALVWVEEIHISTLESQRRRMTPSMTDLEWALPGLQRRRADQLARRHYVWQRGERIGDYRLDAAGESYLHRYDIHDGA